jgi:peptide/nickel transport system permease protein
MPCSIRGCVISMVEARAFRRPLPRLPRTLRYAMIVLSCVALLGLGAPLLAPYDPNEQLDVVGGQKKPPLSRLAAVKTTEGRWLLVEEARWRPEGLEVEHNGQIKVLPAESIVNRKGESVGEQRFFLFGSDQFSRDLFSRWLYATRISLAIATLSILLALGFGLLIGTLAALGPRWLDALAMRLADVFLAFPWLILLLAIAAFLPTNSTVLIIVLACTTWMGVARLVRSELLVLKQKEFVLVASGFGWSKAKILRHHLLPNILTPISVDTTLRAGQVILAEAALSFLGFGIQAPEPSWGNMIAEGRFFFAGGWWIAFFPALALTLTSMALQFGADGLRDWLDPRRQGQES